MCLVSGRQEEKLRIMPATHSRRRPEPGVSVFDPTRKRVSECVAELRFELQGLWGGIDVTRRRSVAHR